MEAVGPSRALVLATRLREGDFTVAGSVVSLLESTAPADREEAKELLEALSPRALGGEAPGQIVGVTGPPGAGKSTLLRAVVGALRAEGERGVAVLAVDPSSRLSGGSLLADRIRIAGGEPDPAVFIRSAAAGTRYGGLARGTREAAEVLAVAFPWVVVETVGVGQSETEVAELADTVCLVVQPASGDTLQFLKAGIMEVPDLLVVTKADLGEPARRTAAELETALGALGRKEIPVLAVSALSPPSGIGELIAALRAHGAKLRAKDGRALGERRSQGRRLGALSAFTRERGERAVEALGGRRRALALLEELPAEASLGELVEHLTARARSRGALPQHG